jgi:hypothetical protein
VQHILFDIDLKTHTAETTIKEQFLTTVYLYYCRSLQASSSEVTLSQGWFLILGLITIISLDLLPYVVVQAKVENDIPSENLCMIDMQGQPQTIQ